MPPLAGKPPYATDEPDSFYESPPQPQLRQRLPPPQNPNARSSAYDVYDNYLNDNNGRGISGAGAVGLHLMNGSMDDDSDDEKDGRKEAGPLPSKHAALAAATREPSPPPQYIAAPKPGYAAPINALNLARPESAAAPTGRQPTHDRAPPNLRIDAQAAQAQSRNPFENPPGHNQHVYQTSTPSPISSTPHPLQPPITPITPVFARPARVGSHSPDVKFSEKPIMRSNTEETLLPRRGDRGDDFWRRFSMVAKEENRKPSKSKTSQWLKKSQNGFKNMSRWVWMAAIILILLIAGGIGLGWYISHDAPDHYQPGAVGGAGEQSARVSSSMSIIGNAGSTMHVQPTNTVDRRAAEPFITTPVRRSKRHTSRLEH